MFKKSKSKNTIPDDIEKLIEDKIKLFLGRRSFIETLLAGGIITVGLAKPVSGKTVITDDMLKTGIVLSSLFQCEYISSDYNAKYSDFILADSSNGDITVYLPKPLSGRCIVVKKIDNSDNQVTISSGNYNIDNITNNFSLVKQTECVFLVGSNDGWWMI